MKNINLKGGGDKTYGISAPLVNTLSDWGFSDDMWQIYYYDYSDWDEDLQTAISFNHNPLSIIIAAFSH